MRASGPYPQRIIDEANEDLDHLCSVFVTAEVAVYRPDMPRTGLRPGANDWWSWNRSSLKISRPRDGALLSRVLLSGASTSTRH